MNTEIDKLQIVIEAEAGNAADGIDRFIESIEKVKQLTSADFAGLGGITKVFKELSSAVSGASKSFNNFSTKIINLKTALFALNNLDVTDATGFVKGFTELEGLSEMNNFAMGVNTMANGLNKLDKLELESITGNIEALVEAIKPLTDEMIRGGAQVGTYGEQMRAFVSAAKSAVSAQVSLSKAEKMSKTGTGGIFGGLTTFLNNIKSNAVFAFVVKSVKQVARTVSSAVSDVSDYIEALNLFTVSMGSFAKEAGGFVEQMETLLGANAAEVSKNIGTFMSLGKSFGIAGDQAYLMSKNLTQLAYDYASFFNITVEDAYEKLRSGFVGEIEPMRAIGKDLSVARLQQELYNMGINAQVENLTQADKATLRYIVTMKQSGDQMNDLARTIQSPANMIRMLVSQFQILSRTIGSIFLPALSSILPYAIAVVKVLTQVAQAIANLFGATLPEFSSTNESLEDVTSGVGGIGDAAQQANKDVLTLIGGFDELNKINVPTANAAGAGGTNILEGIELPEYNIFDQLVENKVDEIVRRITESFQELSEILKDMGIDEVINDFKRFGEEVWEQINSYDFSGAVTNALLSAVDLAISAVNLSNKMVLPLVVALDIPGIVYEATNTFTSFLDMLDSVIESVTPGIQTFVDLALVPMAEWLGGKIKDGLQTMSDEFDELGRWFDNHTEDFTVLGEKLGEVAEGLWSFIEPLADQAWDKFKGLVSQIFDIFKSWGDSILPIVTNFADLTTELRTFMETTGITAEATEFLKEQISAVGVILQGVLRILEGIGLFLLGTFTNSWETAWDGIKTTVTGAWDIIVGAVNTALGGVINLIGKWFGEDIAQWFSVEKWSEMGDQVVDGLIEGISNLNGLVPVFEKVIEIAKNIFGIHSPSTEFEHLGQMNIQGLVKGMETWNAAMRVFETGLTKLKQTFTNSWSQINSKTADFFSSFTSTVQSSMQSVQDTVQLRMQEISNNWSAAWENLRKLTANLLSQIRQESSSAFSNLRSQASSFISGLRSEWTNGWNSIKNSTTSIFSSIRSAASSAFSSISSAVSSVISKIKSAISSLKDLLSWKDKTDDIDFDSSSSSGLRGIAAMRADKGLSYTAFASGGAVTEPTYALVGEYASAKNNPEVIAPQNVIEESVVNANGDMVGALYEMAAMIVTAIENNTVSVEADSDAMFKVVRKKGVDYQRNTGKPVFSP